MVDWNAVNATEDVDANDHKASESLSMETPIGTFLCTVVGSEPREKTFSAYSCHAANLKMRIDRVLELQGPVINEDGTIAVKETDMVLEDGLWVERKNVPILAYQPIPPDKEFEIDALHCGSFLFDEVNLYHPKEKNFFKKRRLFVLKKCKVIDASVSQITTKMFAEDIVGKQVVVTTELETWESKKKTVVDTDGKQIPRIESKVKVKTDGYEYAESANQNDDDLNI